VLARWEPATEKMASELQVSKHLNLEMALCLAITIWWELHLWTSSMQSAAHKTQNKRINLACLQKCAKPNFETSCSRSMMMHARPATPKVPHATPPGCLHGNCLAFLDGSCRCMQRRHSPKTPSNVQLLVSLQRGNQDVIGVIDNGSSRGERTSNASQASHKCI